MVLKLGQHLTKHSRGTTFPSLWNGGGDCVQRSILIFYVVENRAPRSKKWLSFSIFQLYVCEVFLTSLWGTLSWFVALQALWKMYMSICRDPLETLRMIFVMNHVWGCKLHHVYNIKRVASSWYKGHCCWSTSSLVSLWVPRCFLVFFVVAVCFDASITCVTLWCGMAWIWFMMFNTYKIASTVTEVVVNSTWIILFEMDPFLEFIGDDIMRSGSLSKPNRFSPNDLEVFKLESNWSIVNRSGKTKFDLIGLAQFGSVRLEFGQTELKPVYEAQA